MRLAPLLVVSSALVLLPTAVVAAPAVYCPARGSVCERLAANEVARYAYLRTGALLPVREGVPARVAGGCVVVARRGHLAPLRLPAGVAGQVGRLKAQEYVLRSVGSAARPGVLVIGADDAGVLYGAYRLAETLGVRFSLYGDIVPDARVPYQLPRLNEVGRPLFALRGIQPFHDFPEGPDWWNVDDYKAIIGQLPKLRMNFIGLHTYPEGGVGPEPAVWIGPPYELDLRGRVIAAYTASWANTLRGTWGYAPRKTSAYSYGGALLFDRDDYGADVMRGLSPAPTTPAGEVALFERSGAMLRAAFSEARALQVKTCVGTETPLTVPAAVTDRLRRRPDRPALPPDVVRELYRGIFLRAAREYRPDYYWLWTPENWTWSGASDAEVQATVSDLQKALAAAKDVNAPFTLATCGWVLGPPKDRAQFDNLLPKSMPFSCINRAVGNEPVDPGFARVTGRPKWAIPWLEDDPGLTAAQLWAGRMRQDARDALRYGCTGLMGIHWRTRALDANVAALADAAWTQTGWRSSPALDARRVTDGPLGGQFAAFPDARVSGTDEEALYRTVRYNVDGYRLRLPNGRYRVTLRFCEPHYRSAGLRVFGVKLQGRTVIDRLDVFEKVGGNRALDYTYLDVLVANGRLAIDFTRIVEFPCIAAIDIVGARAMRKINCGGPAYRDWAADWPPSGQQGPPPGRYGPTGDFYADWARTRFGPEGAREIAAVFERIDGVLPRPVGWIAGPGEIGPDASAWPRAKETYRFLDQLERLRPRVRGAANLERYDYWLNTFRFMRAIERVKYTWAQLNDALSAAETAPERDRAGLAEARAVPARRALVQAVGAAYGYLLATVSTRGEMGTVDNWERGSMVRALDETGARLVKLLGRPLPAEAQAPAAYAGKPRVIVPTVRTAANRGEALRIEAIVLSARPAAAVNLWWRPMGRGAYERRSMRNVGRATYAGALPPCRGAVEYYVEAAVPAAGTARFPATGPAAAQTVVCMESAR